jgi:hypothetical protein
MGTHLNMQANIANLEGGLLADVNTDEVGGIFV